MLAEAYNTRGQIRYLWVDFDEAVQDYTRAVQLDPGLAEAFYNRGQVHYRLGMCVHTYVRTYVCMQLGDMICRVGLDPPKAQCSTAVGLAPPRLIEGFIL